MTIFTTPTGRRVPLKPLGAAAVIMDGEGRVLLVKHSYGRLNWEIPGGLAELGESATENAVREVREETGLEVEALRLAGIYYEPGNDMHHFIFLCAKRDPTAVPVPDASEITELGYFSPDNLPRPISDFTVLRIRDALSSDSAVVLPTVIGPRQWLE
jgi:8-oxo-dGTP diphosphatase